MKYRPILRYTKEVILLSLFALVWVAVSCSKSESQYVTQKYHADSIPTILTDSISTFITDSGRVKYKVIAQQSMIFDKASDPYWLFPMGIYLEEYDSIFQVRTSIKADSAWNFTQRETWRLYGNVLIKNADSTTFRTEELFWDQRMQRIYTDKYITISSPERTLQGYGMDAKQDLSTFRILQPTGTMAVTEEMDR